MYKSFLLFILFFAALANSHADDRKSEVEKALTRVEETQADQSTWEGRNSDQPYLVLISEYETNLNDDWSYDETYHTRIKIQDERAMQLGQWPVYYNKSREEIIDIQAFAETPEGKKFPSAAIEDVAVFEGLAMYDDMRVKVITLPQVTVGSVIDVTVKSRVQHKEMAGEFWDEIVYPQVPAKYARHTYIFPPSKSILFKSYQRNYKPLIDRKDGKTKYSFVFEKTEDAPREDLMPPLDEVNGGLYLSSIKDWGMVASWLRESIKKNIIDEELISNKAKEVVKDKGTTKAKVQALIDFIQGNFRYVSLTFGDHMVDFHQTVDTFKNRYGDSKDICLLLKQMLNSVGIFADIVLMTGEFSGDPEHALPTPSIFEHVILQVRLDQEKVFIDPQIKGFEIGQYPSSYDNAHVFVVEDSAYRFDHLPILGVEGRILSNEATINIAADGSAVFDVRVILPLEASQSFRIQWVNMPKEDREKFFEGMEASFAKGGQMLSYDVKGADQVNGPVELLLKYRAPAAYPIVNDMILVKEADQSDMPDFKAVKRKYPIFMPVNSLIKNKNVYVIAPELVIDFVPKDYELKIDFMNVKASYERTGNTVTVKTEYLTQRATLDPKRYAEVLVFKETLAAKNEQYIVLKIKNRDTQPAKEWIKKQ